MPPINWDTVQQVIRIILYSGGSYLFGDAVANAELYQAFIGGALAVGAFIWWLVWESGTVHKVAPVVLFLMTTFLATQLLIACEVDPATQEFCKTTYTSKEACEADAKCEWKLRSDGEEVCRAARY